MITATEEIQLKDHYGQELNIGDLVLGAKAGGRFGITSFIHSIVIGRTKHMVQVHQVMHNQSPTEMLTSLRYRGCIGGRVKPLDLIRVEKALFTPKALTKAQDKGRSDPTLPLPRRRGRRT